MEFDDKPDKTTDLAQFLTLKYRAENIVRLPTKSRGFGIISKGELAPGVYLAEAPGVYLAEAPGIYLAEAPGVYLAEAPGVYLAEAPGVHLAEAPGVYLAEAPGVYLAEALTEGVDGCCVTSIVNTSEEDITIKIPLVELEEVEDDYENSVLIFPVLLNENDNRLSKLRNELRTEHLNSEEIVSLIKICEEYNYVFYLPRDKLTFTTAAEHAVPTPAIDPTRGINSKPYRIPGSTLGRSPKTNRSDVARWDYRAKH